MKAAFIFPGQGAQYPGMGKDFYEKFEIAKKIYDKASDVAGMDITELCFEENDKLNITKYTQIAMLVTSVAMLRVLEHEGVRPDVCAGLSLGEYSALVAANIMEFEDAVTVVKKRGVLMQEAVPTGGAMAAVLGTEQKLIEKICEETEGIVEIANYNCPGQIVISGESKAVDAASVKLKEAGAKRVVALNVSGPFHSSMLRKAGEKLGKTLESVQLNSITIPYIANVNAGCITDVREVKTLLERQVSSSVCWEQSIRNMINAGVEMFVEIGPGKTLTAFVKKIDRGVKTCNISKIEDIETVVNELKQQ